MNDFTKKELKYLLKIVEYDAGISDIWTSPLLTKIQSLIDSYCEHDNECEHDWSVGFGSIHSPVIYCNKCYRQKPALSYEVFKKVMGANNE